MSNGRPVLLVEDESDLRDALALLIRERGYVVETARNGEEALEKISHIGSPSLILLNLRMPEMGGAALQAELEKRPELADVPLVVISGSEKIVAEATRLNAVAYLQKPIDLDCLYSILARYLT